MKLSVYVMGRDVAVLEQSLLLTSMARQGRRVAKNNRGRDRAQRPKG